MHPIFLHNVRIFDGRAVISSGNVLVQDGTIVAVGGEEIAPPDEAQVIDGTGCTLLPGFIDAHTHMQKHSLRQSLIFGVTTELDMCCPAYTVVQEIKQQQAMDLADLRSAGVAATAPGGHGAMQGMPIPTLTSPQEAQDFVDARIAEGSDYIKIIYDNCAYVMGRPIPTLNKETMAAVVKAAHKRGKLAIAHVLQLRDACDAIEVGVDGLAHLFVDQFPDANFGRFVADHHAFVVPTLTALESATGKASGASLTADRHMAPYFTSLDQKMSHMHFPTAVPLFYSAAEEAVRQLHAEGVPLLAGTDAPVPGILHGAGLHRELELLVQAGLTPIEALTAATSTPAYVFELHDRGRIAAGLRADLVLVEGDPTSDILATRAIVGVWKRGIPVDRDLYRRQVASHPLAPHGSESGLVSDFEDGSLHTQFGVGWEICTDRQSAGNSTAECRVVPEGPGQNKGSLLIQGEVAPEQVLTRAGMIFYPGAVPMMPANLSEKTGLSFSTRGDGRRYYVQITALNNTFARPWRVSFVAESAWQTISISLEEAGPLDLENLLSVLFTADETPGPFWFQIDDVIFTKEKA